MNKNFREFEKEIKQKLQKTLGRKYQFAEKEFDGINGMVKHSLILICADKDLHPCINLDKYYSQYKSGVDIDILAEKILESCREDSTISTSSISQFKDWENVKPYIYAKLINTHKNLPLLTKIPNRDYLDLSLVYYVRLESSFTEEYAVVQINNEQMQYWGVNEDMLYQSAWSNILNPNEAVVENIANVLSPFFLKNEFKNTDSKEDIQMYVLSNRCCMNGAVQMCNRKAVREAAEMLEDDLWILPSSVHEVILLPVCRTEDCAAGLAGIVKEINNTQLEPNEILSNHVYHYSRKTGEITIAA